MGPVTLALLEPADCSLSKRRGSVLGAQLGTNRSSSRRRKRTSSPRSSCSWHGKRWPTSHSFFLSLLLHGRFLLLPQLHEGHWKDVPLVWRQLYAYAALVVAIVLVRQNRFDKASLCSLLSLSLCCLWGKPHHLTCARCPLCLGRLSARWIWPC